MTQGTQTSTNDGTLTATGSNVKLTAAFYINRDVAPMIKEELNNLNRPPESTLRAGSRQDVEGNFPLCVDGPQMADIDCIQLALESSGDVNGAFAAMSRTLKYMLDLTDLPNQWLGYTLIYQAVLPPEGDADEALDGCQIVKLLDSSVRLYKLAQADMSDGTVRLLDIPNQGDGLAEAMVYITISRSEYREAFESEVLYGPGATLLMPDLIAHKAYEQTREYSDDNIPLKYQKRLETTQETIKRLLESENTEGMKNLLKELTRRDEPLILFVTYLKSLHISLEQYLNSYASWKNELGNNNIIEYHYSYLKRRARELDLMVAEGQGILEAAERATSRAQVQVNEAQARNQQAQARNQQLIQTLLALVAAVLAVPQLVDQDVAGALLGVFGTSVPSGNWGTLVLAGVQTAITVAVAVLFWRIVRRFSA